MTKRSEPLTADRIREVGTEPPLPPILENIPVILRPEALVFLLEHATAHPGPLDRANRIILKGFFFGSGQQETRFKKILAELLEAGIAASKTTPKNRLETALAAFEQYSGTAVAADLLASRFISERSGVASDEEGGGSKASGGTIKISALPPAEMRGLSGVAIVAKTNVDFCGITAGGSVGTDSFRDALRKSTSAKVAFRFLLLNPESEAFAKRAEEEEEPPEAWRLTLFATLHRLKSYRTSLGANIEVRITSSYPAWRLMILDNETVYINSYMAGKRGTESTQYVISRDVPEMVNGFRAHFAALWETGTIVDFDGEGGPHLALTSQEA